MFSFKGNYKGTVQKTYEIQAGSGTEPDKITVGTVVSVKKHGAVVRVTSVKKKEVEYVRCSNKKADRVIIPHTVKINGKVYKVTAICKKALKGNKYITWLWIGSNVKIIGKQAFYGCKKLKTVTIKSTKLKKKGFGEKAFSKIHKKVKYKLPASKKKYYLAILRKY